MKRLRPLRVVLLLFLLALISGATKLVKSESGSLPDNVAIVSVESLDLFAGGKQMWAQVGGLIVRNGRPTVVTPAHALIRDIRFVTVIIGDNLFDIPKKSIEIFLDRDLAYIPLPENYPVISAFKIGNQDIKVDELFVVGFVRSGDFSRDRAIYSGKAGIKLKFAKGKMFFKNQGTLCELTKDLTLCAKYGAILGFMGIDREVRPEYKEAFIARLSEEPGILSGRMEAYSANSRVLYISGSLVIDEKGFLRSVIVRRSENCGQNCLFIGSLVE